MGEVMSITWLTTLDGELRKAFQAAGVPLSEAQAFDGGGWVWSGREYLDRPPDSAGSRVAQIQFRAQPDRLRDGPQIELSAAAWGLKSRRTAWSRICWARYVDPGELGGDRLIEELTPLLTEAWRDAHLAAEHLDPSHDPRSEAINMLQEKGIPVRAHPASSSELAVH
jgi:hypothetical protein